MRVVCLASGRGSNFQALLEAQRRGRLGTARIVALGVNRPGCGALERAESNGVPHFVVDHREHEGRASFEEALCAHIKGFQADLVVLAGFMRILTDTFLEGVGVPVVNLHPALLPAFPGTSGIEDAFAAKVRLSGCSTHLVTLAVDEGPILMQGLVPIYPADQLADFKERMHAMEHRLLPATVEAMASGHLQCTSEGLVAADHFQPFLLPDTR